MGVVARLSRAFRARCGAEREARPQGFSSQRCGGLCGCVVPGSEPPYLLLLCAVVTLQ